MEQFPGSALGLDIHNFPRDTAGYHRIQRIYRGELSSFLEQLCRQCPEMGEATDEKFAELQQRMRSGTGSDLEATPTSIERPSGGDSPSETGLGLGRFPHSAPPR